MFWGRPECPACAHERAFLYGGFRSCGGIELEVEECGEDARQYAPCVGRNKVGGSGDAGGVEPTGPVEEDKEISRGVGA